MGIEISRLHVRRSSFLHAPPERVWREFADFERLEAWFGQGHTLEKYAARLGGEVLLSVVSDGERRVRRRDPGLRARTRVDLREQLGRGRLATADPDHAAPDATL